MLITRDARRALSVRRRAVVQHAVRPRRHHHRAASACGSTRRSRAACSRFLAAHAGDATIDAEQRRRAGQDPARDARGEMARAGRDPVRPLLRQRRLDAAVRDARRRLLRAHRRPRRSSSALWPHVERALALDRRATATATATASSSTAAHAEQGLVQPGLEGLARLGLPRRRHARRGADRAVRGAGLRLRAPSAAPRELARGARRRATRASARATRRATLRERFERRVLVRGARHLRARARRRQAAVPRCARRTPGHCLFTGIAAPGARRARRRRRCSRPSRSRGWGVRTVADGEARYNPMSYHNGSVWPHDNALIARGLARYGLKDDGHARS